MKTLGPNWAKLRIWRTSQEDAFEELCCQLARTEPTPKGSTFVRNAPPDAGVECVWILSDESEWGWQAKFPQTGLSQSVWSELDESVTTALTKRPKLTRYFVCLPLLLSDARLKGRKSAREKWKARVAKWTALAKKAKRKVQFVLWDEHELWTRLSLEEHRGRRTFWFGETVFDVPWFRANIQTAIEQAGDRYDALLNVAVPEIGFFPALARSPEFWANLDRWAISLREAITGDLGPTDHDSIKTERMDLRKALSACLLEINNLARDESSNLEFGKVGQALEKVSAACAVLRKKQWELERLASQEFTKKHGREPGRHEHAGTEFNWYTLQNIEQRVYKAQNYLRTKAAALVNKPALLLNGEAGSGKTHLLCNVAEKLLSVGVPVVLLMGEQFHDSDPWSQILNHLGLNCGRDEFLGALDAAAEASQCRAVLIIDALNEGEGLKVWPRHLSSFLSNIRRWPRLSVCLSVRIGYETVVLPAGLAENTFVCATHSGFAQLEAEASTRFFEYFGISIPSLTFAD